MLDRLILISVGHNGLKLHAGVYIHPWGLVFNTLRLRQNGHHFPDDIFKCIFLNENEWIPIKISLKLVPKCQINNIPSLFQIMAWRRPGDKPLSEAMMVSLLTHICVTRPQWVNVFMTILFPCDNPYVSSQWILNFPFPMGCIYVTPSLFLEIPSLCKCNDQCLFHLFFPTL